MKGYQAFRISVVSALIAAHAVYEVGREAAFDIRILFLLGAVYAAAIFARDYFYGDSTTFFDIDHHGHQPGKEELVIFGNRIEDLAHESKERRLLISLIDLDGGKIKIYLAWIVSIALALYLQARLRPVTGLDLGIPAIVLTGIFFAPFLSQMLTPVFVSFLFALYAFCAVDSLPVSATFVGYLLCFAATLFLYRELPAERADASRKRKPAAVAKSVAGIVALMVAVFWCFNALIPKENPFRSKPSVEKVAVRPPSALSTDRISRDVAEQVLKWQERRGERPGAGSADSPGGGSGDGESRRGGSGPGRGGGPGTGGGSGPGRGGGTEPRPGGASTPDRKQSDAKGSTAPSGGGPPSEAEPPSGGSSEVPERPQAPPADTKPPNSDEGKTEAAADNAAAVKGDGSGKGNGNGEGDRASKSDGAGESDGAGQGDRGQVDGAGRPSGEGKGQARPAEERSAGARESKAPLREQKLEKIQRDLKIPLEVTKALLLIVGVGVALFFLSRFFSSAKEEKDDGIKVQQLTERQKKKLNSVLSQIRGRGLKAEEEVIETYNAVLTIFEFGHYPREEWLPAEDFSIQIATSVPPLSAPFSNATRRFARTLYGRKAVAENELQDFRSDVARILRFFQVS